MGPRELCTCLHALAQLRHAPPAAWTARLLHAARGQLQAFSPRDLSTLVWALGSLRALGGSGGAVRAEEEAGGAAGRRPSLGSLGATGGGAAIRGVMAAAGGGAAGQGRPGESAIVVDADFMKAFEIACLGSLRRFNPQDLSTLAVGLDRLQHSPSPALASAYLECVLAVLPQCRAQVRH